jgi:lipoprotein NlpD
MFSGVGKIYRVRELGLLLTRHVSRVTCHEFRIRISLVFLIMISACSHEPPRTASTYTVKKGDTLYSIAWRHGVDYKDLARWNGIGRDYAIKPGQVLKFSSYGPQPAQSATAKAPASVQRTENAMPVGPPIQWLWPVQSGNVTLTTRPNGGQGLTIAGISGQEIRSAAAGRVVYTGSGLLGYGQLVIVQHNDTYLSAYGHTKTVLVHEQDAVQAGQSIATMGEGPNGSPVLYFEIRINGRPTDPRPLLPPIK